MNLEVRVGEAPARRIEFSWDRMWGRVRITVDGIEVLRTRQNFTFDVVTDWTIASSGDDGHVVTFRKIRPQFFAGYRPQTLVAFVDQNEVARKTEGLNSKQAVWLIAIGVASALAGIAIVYGVLSLVTRLVP